MTFKDEVYSGAGATIRVRLRLEPGEESLMQCEGVAMSLRLGAEGLTMAAFMRALVYIGVRLGPETRVRSAKPSDGLGCGSWYVFEREEGGS